MHKTSTNFICKITPTYLSYSQKKSTLPHQHQLLIRPGHERFLPSIPESLKYEWFCFYWCSQKWPSYQAIKIFRFAVSFRGTGSAFFFLRLFKLAHICIEVTSIHKGDTSESIEQFFL